MSNEAAKPKILIVDDSRIDFEILNEALKAEYEIIAAVNGREGVALAGSDYTPDLILLDIVMPEMDGYEACRVLKNSPKTKNIPVIFLTSMTEKEDETKAFELGAVDYITKPFNVIVVKARVRTHIELKRHRDFLERMLEKRSKELQDMEKEYSLLFYRR